MDTQTGHQAALFDAPRDPGQGALFGGLYLAADELAELGDDNNGPAAMRRFMREHPIAGDAHGALLRGEIR